MRYLGPIYKKEDLVFLRRHAFAYIHGHTVGGTNPVLLEAMAIGNSIIARGVPFNREVLKESGIFFTTPGHLSQVIAEVEAWKPDEHRRRARQNLGRVKSLYNWERVTRVYEELFHSLVRRGR